MNGAHVTGAALGALLGAVLAPLLARYGVNVTDTTASLIGTGAVALGVGLGHVVSTQGVWPALKRVFVGPPSQITEYSQATSARTTQPTVATPAPPPPTPPASPQP